QAAADAAQAIADAAAAQAEANAAHTLAGTAESNAQAAIVAAGDEQDSTDTLRDDLGTAIGGVVDRVKANPMIYYGTSAAAGTAPAFSIWFQVNETGQVIGQWQQLAGGGWEKRDIRSEVIANLDVGKLTAGSAAIGSRRAEDRRR